MKRREFLLAPAMLAAEMRGVSAQHPAKMKRLAIALAWRSTGLTRMRENYENARPVLRQKGLTR
jgi:hypothetical protein